MLNTFDHLTGSIVTANDGAIGHVKAVFFDDAACTIRYLVVDTGTWLSGREVLISPYSVMQPLGTGNNIDVTLSRQQVRDSPDIDTHQPVSRQHEREFSSYYAYPDYWTGRGLWGIGAYPILPQSPPDAQDLAQTQAALAKESKPEDAHLRSSAKIIGYDVHATDESIGHVEDFVFDDESWTLRYLVVNTRNWWPGGRKVLLAMHWLDRIEWATGTVHVKLTREQVKASPEYTDTMPLARDYERRLHEAYGRVGYWV